jgi:hypothetical protein
VAGPCEYGKQHLGSIKGRECVDLLRDYYLLKEDSTSWGWLLTLIGGRKDTAQ